MNIKEIEKNSTTEIVINKSKFFAYSFIVHNEFEVEKFLNEIRKNHSTATHICYAFRLQTSEEKCSDDGEPQGTAGKPILDVIKKSKFENLLIAVVRYFGGIKLGAGGLVRAYSNSASTVLSLSGEKQSLECQKLSFNISLSESKYVKIIQNISCIKKSEVTYKDKILIDIFVEEIEIKNIKTQIQNILMREIDFSIDTNIYYV